MNTKILFLDLDGTLLNDRKEITPGNRQAIQRALQAGHRVVVTSGRPRSSALSLAQRLNLAGPGCFVVSYNGGIITDCSTGQDLIHRTLDLEDLYRILDEASRRGIYLHTYDQEKVLLDRHSCEDTARFYCNLTGMEYRVVEQLRTSLSGSPSKALMIDLQSPASLEAMQEWILDRMSQRVDCFFSSRSFLEVVPAGVSKGNAVSHLCHRLNLPPECSIAAGDEANDISMIRAAGVGVAMRNAQPEVKAAAEYITEHDNNHDGVAEIIETFLLTP